MAIWVTTLTFTGFKSGFQSFFTKVWVCFNQSREQVLFGHHMQLCNFNSICPLVCMFSVSNSCRGLFSCTMKSGLRSGMPFLPCSGLWYCLFFHLPFCRNIYDYTTLPTFLTSWSGLLSMQHELVGDPWFCSISPWYFCCPGRHGEEVWERLHYGSIRHSVFQSPLVMSLLHMEIAPCKE